MGDDTLIEQVRRRYLAVNGDHPMTEDDDAYVRQHFVEATPEAMVLMLEDRLPLPSYLLSDGTPMVPAAHGALAEVAGGVDALHDWFVAFWPDDPATAEAEWGHYLSGQYVCLKEVSPIRIRMKTARVAEASAATEVLRRDPHDEIGRGMIGQAVDGVLAVPGLDAILLPMTGYDRLRFGGPTVRETWVDGPRREFLTPVAPVWPLRTERLLLRPWRAGDEAALAEAWADEDYVSLLLTGTQNAAEVAEMVRRRSDPGDGMLVGLVAEHDGEVVGDSLLILQGTGLTEGEIGWTVLPRHTGRGYATEAARAVLRLAFEHYGLRRVVANLPATTAPPPSASASGCAGRPTASATSGPRASGPTPTSTPSSARSGARSSPERPTYATRVRLLALDRRFQGRLLGHVYAGAGLWMTPDATAPDRRPLDAWHSTRNSRSSAPTPSSTG